MEVIETSVDDRGRITIPIQIREKFKPDSRVRWVLEGNKMVVSFVNVDDSEMLTDTYLQNQIVNMRKELNFLVSRVEQLNKTIFSHMMREIPQATVNAMMIEVEHEMVKDKGSATGQAGVQ